MPQWVVVVVFVAASWLLLAVVGGLLAGRLLELVLRLVHRQSRGRSV